MSSSVVKDIMKQRIKEAVEREQYFANLAQGKSKTHSELSPGECPATYAEETYKELVKEHDRKSSQHQAILGAEPDLTQEQDLERRLGSLQEVINVHASERSAELRNDPTVDQERIPDIIRVEMYELRRERDQLYNRLRGLNAELGFGLQQEIER